MTDKQIIIDGVDVSGCEFATKAEMACDTHCRLYDYKYCIGKDCLYKQLKQDEQRIVELNKTIQAKEQECEELRKQYNCYACDTCKGKEDYINLKRHCENAIKSLHNKQAELDQLKFDYVELEKRHNDSFEQFKQLKADREEALKQLEFVRTLNTVKEAENRKLSKTLTEIKEICNKTVCDYLQCSLNYNHSKDFECEKTSCNRAKRRKFILQILQKISEVKDE